MSIRGLSFVVTGAMTRTRPEMIDVIERNGGYVHPKVRSGTSYVVVGKRVGNTKLNDAYDLGRPFITENELWRLIEDERSIPRTVSREQVILYSSDPQFNELSLYRVDAQSNAQALINQARTTPAEEPAATPEGFSISSFFMFEE